MTAERGQDAHAQNAVLAGEDSAVDARHAVVRPGLNPAESRRLAGVRSQHQGLTAAEGLLPFPGVSVVMVAKKFVS